ncbi:MAG: DUF981 family protein [Candidatus Micrarchaeaceae archaeon]
MPFIDSLTIMLLSLGMSTAILAIYFLMNALGRRDTNKLYIPMLVFGLFDAISGGIMSFTWPLPGAYNMLFGDPLLMLGLIMIAGSYMLMKEIKVGILSVAGIFLGLYLAVESAGIVNFKLESGNNLIGALGLYVLSAVAGLISPIAILDARRNRKAYFFMFIILALITLVALFIGYSGIYEHLASPP